MFHRNTRRDLVICLCLEDLDVCDVIIHRIASGHVFGEQQPIRLLLQGNDPKKLEDLRMDIQDCAFSLVQDVKTIPVLSNSHTEVPDIVMIVLADRFISPDSGSNSHEITTSDFGELSDLSALVGHVNGISQMLVSWNGLQSAKVLVLGDLALPTASLLSRTLGPALTASQMLALDGRLRTHSQDNLTTITNARRGLYGKVCSICSSLKQWWDGAVQSMPDGPYLGTKFFSSKNSLAAEDCDAGSVYYLYAPVHLVGPMNFRIGSDVHLDSSHIKDVKAVSDRLIKLSDEIFDQTQVKKNTRKNFSKSFL